MLPRGPSYFNRYIHALAISNVSPWRVIMLGDAEIDTPVHSFQRFGIFVALHVY